MKLEIDEIRSGLEADVIVVGGGPAGMCAAICAARQGVRVILVEESGACGGMAARALVGPFMTCYEEPGLMQPVPSASYLLVWPWGRRQERQLPWQ